MSWCLVGYHMSVDVVIGYSATALPPHEECRRKNRDPNTQNDRQEYIVATSRNKE